MTTATATGAHILVYPFPTAGHIIPLLDLADLLLNRGLQITFAVTPNNLPLLDPLVSSHASPQLQRLVLPVPENLSGSKNRLLLLMQSFEEHHCPFLLNWFQSHNSPPVAIISDFFLGWTQQLASQVGVPRVVFSPSGAFAYAVSACIWRDKPKNHEPENMDFLVSFPNIPSSPTYPWWQIPYIYTMYKEGDPDWVFFRSCFLSNLASWGIVFNSFGDLERPYLDHMNKEYGNDRVWAVGPAMPGEDDLLGPSNRGGSSSVPCHKVLTWLDAHKDNSVVFVCFGSRTTFTCKQMEELAVALEKSGVHFILCVRLPSQQQMPSDDGVLPDGFEDRVAGRGFIIKGWAPQVAILRHSAVGAFLTHCGWNSVLEGIAGGVVMLTWPMSADQFTNAQLLVDQLGVGIRVGESTRKIAKSDELARVLVTSLEENLLQRIKIKELQKAALSAVKGGSSNRDLDELVKRLNELKIGGGVNMT